MLSFSRVGSTSWRAPPSTTHFLSGYFLSKLLTIVLVVSPRSMPGPVKMTSSSSI